MSPVVSSGFCPVFLSDHFMGEFWHEIKNFVHFWDINGILMGYQHLFTNVKEKSSWYCDRRDPRGTVPWQPSRILCQEEISASASRLQWLPMEQPAVQERPKVIPSGND